MQSTILVIDDETNIREGLAVALEMEDYAVVLADSGKTGLECIAQGGIDLVITDLSMPEMSGEQVLSTIATENPIIPVIILTGYGSIDSAVDAMRKGAYDFLTKPLNLDNLMVIVKGALKSRELELKHKELLKEVLSRKSFESIIGKSAEMQKIFQMVSKIANTKASVLITGETGVGKELVANALHNLSSRKDAPFIKVHCAALSENLLESELFGHEKGAFTGAITRKRGRFELASGGTIFLDEIGEIDQNVQIKILRVLQDKRFERVGGEETLTADIRVIAATNRDLEIQIADGRFREDLYFRLNVIQIHVPPLRERKDDIPLMVTAFLEEFAEENGKKIDGIDSCVRRLLSNFEWPGNIRQLRNCIESAVIMCSTSIIAMDDLPSSITGSPEAIADTIAIPSGITMEEAEKIIIQQNLATNKGNKSKTADVLGIGRKTLHRKLDEYNATDNR